MNSEQNETPTFEKKKNIKIELESLPLNSNNMKVQINIDYKDKYLIDPKNQNLFKIFIFLFVCLSLEFVFRDDLKEITLKYFSGAMSQKYLRTIDFYSINGKYILLYLILNYVNVPSALSFLFLDCITIFINGILKFFYLDERPFWNNSNLIPTYCPNDYGSPATMAINSFVIFAVFYKAFTYKTKSKLFKSILWIFCFLNITYIYLKRLYENVHYLNQLLIGLAIGYTIYKIYFDVFDVKFDNGRQFMKFIQNFKLISFLLLILWIIVTYLHSKIILQSPSQATIDLIDKKCQINKIFFDRGNFIKRVSIFEFLGAIFGIYFEYCFIFRKDHHDFLEYNVKSDDCMFNMTSQNTSLIRFLCFYLFQLIFSYLLYFDKGNLKDINQGKINYFLGKLCILTFISSFSIFFIIKNILIYFKLVNLKVFHRRNV